MRRAFFILGLALSTGGLTSAPALTAPARTATASIAPAPTTRVAFGCDARTPNVCYFRIFYTRGDRIVILPSGMKQKVPVTLGSDSYCMTLGKTPAYKCTRKDVNNKYNS